MSDNFHRLAKEAESKIKDFILNYASGATGIFFFALTGKGDEVFNSLQKILVTSALCLFVLTIIFCLIDLHIDTKRFYYVAKQHEISDEKKRKWGKNDWYKKLRLWFLYGSYFTCTLATIITVYFLITKII